MKGTEADYESDVNQGFSTDLAGEEIQPNQSDSIPVLFLSSFFLFFFFFSSKKYLKGKSDLK